MPWILISSPTWRHHLLQLGCIRLRSWKGDYLHRPDSPQGVTTWNTGIGLALERRHDLVPLLDALRPG